MVGVGLRLRHQGIKYSLLALVDTCTHWTPTPSPRFTGRGRGGGEREGGERILVRFCPSTWGMEAGGWETQGYVWLYNKMEAGLTAL